MHVLTNDLKLLIDDFAKNNELKACVPDFYRLLRDYMSKMGHAWIIFSPGRYAPVIGGFLMLHPAQRRVLEKQQATDRGVRRSAP